MAVTGVAAGQGVFTRNASTDGVASGIGSSPATATYAVASGNNNPLTPEQYDRGLFLFTVTLQDSDAEFANMTQESVFEVVWTGSPSTVVLSVPAPPQYTGEAAQVVGRVTRLEVLALDPNNEIITEGQPGAFNVFTTEVSAMISTDNVADLEFVFDVVPPPSVPPHSSRDRRGCVCGCSARSCNSHTHVSSQR